VDYLEAQMREDTEAGRPDFLWAQRNAALVRSGEDDRAKAQEAQRAKASEQKRDATESGSHPL
jgi:hypothetical protein